MAKVQPRYGHRDVPSLKYTSSAYDFEIGYQSRLEIMVAAPNPQLNDDSGIYVS